MVHAHNSHLKMVTDLDYNTMIVNAHACKVNFAYNVSMHSTGLSSKKEESSR